MVEMDETNDDLMRESPVKPAESLQQSSGEDEYDYGAMHLPVSGEYSKVNIPNRGTPLDEDEA